MQPEFKHFEQKFGYKPLAIYPKQLYELPQNKLVTIANQASDYIKALGDKTMFQYAPTDLVDYMNAGLALPVVESLESCKLISFVKALPWFPGNPQPSEKEALQMIAAGHMPTGFESGSLVVPDVFQGTHLGADVKLAFASLIKETFPNVPLFAVVVNTNTKSMQNNIERGWVPITPEQAKALLKTDVLEGWPYESTIFVEPSTVDQSVMLVG